MKDVTPRINFRKLIECLECLGRKINFRKLIRCLRTAIAIVLVITLLRLAFRIFLSVAIWIIPITLILFIYQKFNDRY